MLSLLASLKWLRGTTFDFFGYTAERKSERALIAAYKGLVERVLETITPANYDSAVDLLNLVDMVRGYGVVKEEAMAEYEKQVAKAEAAYYEPAEYVDVKSNIIATTSYYSA